MKHLILFVTISAIWLLAIAPLTIEGHGMLLSPPQRSSMFRFKYNVPPNYNDNSLNCGGYGVRLIIKD